MDNILKELGLQYEGQKGKNKESLLRDGFKVTIKGKNELEKYEIETENTKCI